MLSVSHRVKGISRKCGGGMEDYRYLSVTRLEKVIRFEEVTGQEGFATIHLATGKTCSYRVKKIWKRDCGPLLAADRVIGSCCYSIC